MDNVVTCKVNIPTTLIENIYIATPEFPSRQQQQTRTMHGSRQTDTDLLDRLALSLNENSLSSSDVGLF